jgi:hypothetical protein
MTACFVGSCLSMIGWIRPSPFALLCHPFNRKEIAATNLAEPFCACRRGY